jgi:predicted RNA-binding Zn-ribbon protein involved in translation (DUF1610 family)
LKKKPRFFCDNCGYEVGSDVKTCPYFGRYFASVRCPKCDYSGPDKMFLNGCPMCGYSAAAPKPEKTAPKARKKRAKKPHHHHAEPLPAWAYIVSFLILFLVLAILSYIITR